ncbi:hypothetical protein R1sor_022579 [Riccia sorocarpa]|uniref:Patatin n=1 Tax=Riccia sorocarpa TaxID=122646 RepID=A0ABD3GKB3_9MARC
MPGVAWDGGEEPFRMDFYGPGEQRHPVEDEDEEDMVNCTSSSDCGKVCILSIDGGGMRGIIPGRILAYLEAALKTKSGNPNAKIADFFDVAAGTSVGGIITTMLFTNDGTGAPLFSGEESWKLIAEKGQQIFKIPKSQRAWKKLRGIMTPRYSTKYLEEILKHYLIRDGRALTLRDTLKSVLIPCYDLRSAGPFLFSRADALDCEAWDFTLWEICRATSAVPSFFKPANVASVDGRTSCTAIDGGIVMNNPTAAAITHVLHNKAEFPNVRGMRDLLVLSLGTGQFDKTYGYKKVRHWGAFQWAKPIVKIVLDGISDIVDHTISMSFGGKHRKNYVRVQVSGLPDSALTELDDGSKQNVNRLIKLSDDLLHCKSMEHLPFGGRRPLSETNMERLDWFAEQLVQEHKARLHRKAPTVILKNATRDRSDSDDSQEFRRCVLPVSLAFQT